MYLETSILTKESDVYSFGVVLIEVLCGRLCFQYKDGNSYSLVRSWKQSYKKNKVAEIIFHDLKQHMGSSSLETFSDIAHRCLNKFRKDRPNMFEVVEKLKIALRYQEIYDQVEPSMGFEVTSKSSVRRLVGIFEEERDPLPSAGTLDNEGNPSNVQSAEETSSLTEAKDILEKRVEELKWRLQLEKRLRSDLEEQSAQEIAKLRYDKELNR
ncbi:hypothetical protein L1887_27608 [Cichorium endivia]|nr:hypothetical protein L1887_27608 [Cichorium endivia]